MHMFSLWKLPIFPYIQSRSANLTTTSCLSRSSKYKYHLHFRKIKIVFLFQKIISGCKTLTLQENSFSIRRITQDELTFPHPPKTLSWNSFATTILITTQNLPSLLEVEVEIWWIFAIKFAKLITRSQSEWPVSLKTTFAKNKRNV